MTDLISPAYRAQLVAHATAHPDWGSESGRILDIIPDVRVRALGSTKIIDYGCGTGDFVRRAKKVCAASVPVPDVHGYDPRNEAEWPHPPDSMRGRYDLIVCTDVMEHVERERVADVLADIASLMAPDGVAFFAIATDTCGHVLPETDALPKRNAHITVEPPEWWCAALRAAGLSMQGETTVYSGGFFGWWGKAG